MRTPPVEPYFRPIYNAGSAVHVPYLHRNSELEAVDLDALEYRIDNLTDSVVILEWTTVPPPGMGQPIPARGEITVPATLNDMSRMYRDRELRQVTFRMTDPGGNVTQDLAYYQLSAVFTGVGPLIQGN